ncbi:DNA modification methylase [Halovenus aranensis]|uniref:Type II methyltransferase n=1 Tax=Halovenus aranensis TaxID=890420 RepID=A0A1G8SX15_9EURY|nr:site-specific DNA-methyltransferase [Halovenus aranensis]SDJ33789.1 DNA modification methylase [Halovenus aranensis]
MASEDTDAFDESWASDIHQGDAAETLAEMPESSVHMAMTSPPYFGLRNYGVDGQIGLEDSLDEYISELLDVASELRRVLREDGSWWLNLGDSFAGSWGAQSKDDEANHRSRDAYPGKTPARSGALRRKSKMLVPHRVAIALEDAGWIVRADCPWVKPNPMPHPVKDRLHEHKEFVFHLTPEPDYWFDLDAVREPHKESSLERRGRYDYNTSGTAADAYPNEQNQDDEYIGTEPEDALHPNGKNPGDVFEIPVKAFPEAHFAVYPPELCEAPIKSSCPPTVCAACGTPYERDVEEVPVWERDRSEIEREQLKKALDRFDKSDLTEEHLEAVRRVGFNDAGYTEVHQVGLGKAGEDAEVLAREAKEVLGGYFREITLTAHETAGWSQACDCDTDETDAGIVLDPFAGAGTTCMVAKDLGRRFIGIDLNPDYVALAQKRVGVTVEEPERLLEDDAQTTLVQTDGGRESSPCDTGGE